jgi:predicted ATP-grasp superfamily ATP-dependent carboligase
MPRNRILVTSVSTDPGLSIIRQLVESGYDVIGADWRALPFGLRSRYLTNIHRLKDPIDPDFDRCLVELIKAIQPDAFLPLLETNVVASTCRQAREIQGLTATNIPDSSAFTAAFDKVLCSSECKCLGIPCPVVYSPEEAAEILAGGRGHTVLVVKPRTDAGMARGVAFVANVESLQQSILLCEQCFGSAMIQEFIPGDVSHMHTAVVLFSRNSELIAAFTMQKLRQWPSTGGITALGVSTDEFHLVEKLLPFFQKWQWRGPAEIELKLDPRDGLFKVIEINPRFPGYLRFPIICGVRFGMLAASLAMDDKSVTPLKYPSYAVGIKYANPSFFMRSVFSDVRSASNKSYKLRQAIADLCCIGPAIASMSKDPIPMIGRLLADIQHLTGR